MIYKFSFICNNRASKLSGQTQRNSRRTLWEPQSSWVWKARKRRGNRCVQNKWRSIFFISL